MLAALALVIQLLVPAAAMAHERAAEQVVICTGDGAVTVSLDAEGQPKTHFAGMACDACIFASIAALPAPDLTFSPVVHAPQVVALAPQAAQAALYARPPPKPPSQAPPFRSLTV